MASLTVSRRSMLALLVAGCGQLLGCRNASPIPLNTWARDSHDQFGVESLPTIVFPTLGEGSWALRSEFQQALCEQLRKAKLITLVDGGVSTSQASCSVSCNMMTWDDQLENLGTAQAAQAIASKITYFEPTAPVKLGVVVLLIDTGTRATLRRVEGLWNAAQYQPVPHWKWLDKRADEPVWDDNLCNISPKHLMEQAALEISIELQTVGVIETANPNCSGGPEAPSSQSQSLERLPPALNLTPQLSPGPT